MPDIVRTVSNESWFSRIRGAVVGVLFGLALFAGAFPLLWWNEGRALHRARSLDEGASIVVEARADTVDGANDGKLVHLTGLATTSQTIQDPVFEIAATALRFKRVAETYAEL